MPSPEKNVSVLIVEDHGVASAGLKSILGQNARFSVLGVVNDGGRAEAEIARLDPDIVILDMALPGKSGLAILENLKIRGARQKVLILSGQANGMDFKRAIDLGADSVISKIEPPEIIFDAISVMLGGGRLISDMVLGFVEPIDGQSRISLTARERQILALMAEGLSNAEIARKIGVELRTAKKHRENLMRKLKAHSAVEATRIAWQLGLTAMTPKA